jgi:ABC-2 type transport system ATP-binding protein
MPLISVQDLTHRYPGGVTALDGLTLELEPGIIGFVGANGAGKSTFIKILLGLLTPTHGTVRVLERDAIAESLAVRQLVGYMPEHDCLPPQLTATELVSHMGRLAGLPRAAARERTAEMLRHVGLYEERYRPVSGYSTGMKQRVKLAQALVHDPRLLLLDEPTNGLDPAGRDEMLELIERTGTEFGIAVLGLLAPAGGDRARVRLPGGHRRGAAAERGPAPLLHGEQGVLAVEVDEGAEELLARLTGAGVEAHAEGSLLLLPLRGDGPYDAVRDAAADLGLALVRMEPRRHSLQELFRTPANGDAHAPR